jgi:sulfite reductase (ferredoxin)
VQTLLLEAKDKLGSAIEAYEKQQWADSIYHTYTGFVNGAKAILLAEDIKTNTQAQIIAEFDNTFEGEESLSTNASFSEIVYQIQNNAPSKAFAESYLADANAFFDRVDTFRKKHLKNA